MERRNLKQIVEVINKSLSLAEAHARDSNLCVDEPTCRKYGQQKEMADHFLFDFEALWQV